MPDSAPPVLPPAPSPAAPRLELTRFGCFSRPGLDVLVFNNVYDGSFCDSKLAGVELIHHDVRTFTNGDVRLSPTPEQWDRVPDFGGRTIDQEAGVVEVRLAYPEHNFNYRLRVSARSAGVAVQVWLDQPLPAALVGRAGFNLEFLPTAYRERGCLMDEATRLLPLHPIGPTRRAADGSGERRPILSGRRVVLAPEDPERRIVIRSDQPISLFDGRNQAQNGWFVLRSLLPGGRTGCVLEWTIEPNVVAEWFRPTVVAHSQLGYHPAQRKVAVFEADPRREQPGVARLWHCDRTGAWVERLAEAPQPWGTYLRYRYFTFDFTRVTEPGLYRIEHDGRFGNTFRLAEDVYADAWHPTSDVYLPVQMDHVRVQEAYRVWHGRSHLDDARQAPPGHVHFDLYAMGPTTDSSYEPGQHIPGLAIGGWFDAGDFDLRTQTNYGVVNSLVQAWETFRPERDETTVDPERGLVEMHRPDGVPDLLQQIEHGTRYLLAQHRVFGHAIAGVVEPDLRQYPHLGDAAVKTDNLVFDPALRSDEVVAGCSGRPDDRWAFTTRTSALNYGSASALAAASRALRGWRDELATECLEVARQVWAREQAGPPALFAHGNTTGGPLEEEEVKATVELLLATGDARYAKRLEELWPTISQRLVPLAPAAVRAAPKASKAFRDQLRDRAVQFAQQLVEEEGANPFGVQITRGGWAGNARIVEGGIAAFWLHRAFPELVPAEATLRAMNYLLGCHPATNRSFVSAVGARSKDVAYGMNRADFSFIAGGVVPGVLIIEPDFPENKDDWPFLWGQNEYVVDLAAAYLFLALAADDLVRGEE